MPLLKLTYVGDDVVSRNLKTMAKQTRTINVQHSEKLAHGIARNILSPHLANLVSWKLCKAKKSLGLSADCLIPDESVPDVISTSFAVSTHLFVDRFLPELSSYIKQTKKSRTPLFQLSTSDVKPLINQYVGPTLTALRSALCAKAESEEPINQALRDIQQYQPSATNLDISSLNLPVKNQTRAMIYYHNCMMPTVSTSHAIHQLRLALPLAEHPQTKADIHYNLALCNDGDPVAHLTQALALSVVHDAKLSIHEELYKRRSGRPGTTRNQMIFMTAQRVLDNVER